MSEMHADPRWQTLDEQQRRTLNELHEAYVVPALEQVDRIRREATARVIEAQGQASAARVEVEWLRAELARARIALRGMATSIARSRDDAEANAQARRVESALREQQW